MSQSATRELALTWPTFTISPASLPATQTQTVHKPKGNCALKDQHALLICDKAGRLSPRFQYFLSMDGK